MRDFPVFARLVDNPYAHTVPYLDLLINDLACNRAREVVEGHKRGEFKRNSLAICLMNPAKPARRGTEAVLAMIVIGPEGRDYLPNAVAKAVTHHNTRQDCGIAAYVEPYRLVDGSFVYGHSAEVAGTIAGASGLTEAQDRFMATVLAAEFNYRVTEAHKVWREQHPDNKWFCNVDKPHEEFSAIADLIDEDLDRVLGGIAELL